MNKTEVLTDDEILALAPTYWNQWNVHARAIEQAVLAKLAENGEVVITKNGAGQIAHHPTTAAIEAYKKGLT